MSVDMMIMQNALIDLLIITIGFFFFGIFLLLFCFVVSKCLHS